MTNHTAGDGIHVAITNEAALVVGLIAKQHPGCAVHIDWSSGSDESLWLMTATDGVEDTIYVVHDETGTWFPVSPDEAESVRIGEYLHDDA